ncbi:MAG: molybdopterin-dependent oxidoreductase, partial [Acidimicrobiia bacterium]
MTASTTTTYRTCPLCEATCGLEVTSRGEEIVRIRGDMDDVFSSGYTCPKAVGVKHLDVDPDRLRKPRVRSGSSWTEVSWEDAFALVARRLPPLVAEHGANSVAVYLGNPNVHNMAGMLFARALVRALGSRNVYSAATVDQMPKHLSSGLMFGHPDLIPVPDIDRTDHLVMLGADPLASNGSLATAPDWPGRIQALRDRGGRLVVVDPRRSRTARVATEHVLIRPGTDALLLAAMTNVIFAEGLADAGRLGGVVDHMDVAARALEPFTPARVAPATAIDAGTIRRLAMELGTAERAAVYGRIGTHAVEFGTLSSWLVDLVNVITGNLDRSGGAMFPRSATEGPRRARGFATGRWHSRVSGHPEVRGELPVSALSEEIETPGDGRVRALVTIAGNPVLSTPNSGRLEAALESLDFMIAVDLYQNETTRHADVIFPATSPLRRAHYDLAFYGLSVRNISNYSAPLLEPDDGGRPEWEVLLRLASIAGGQGGSLPIALMDDFVFRTYVEGRLRSSTDLDDVTVEDVLSALADRSGPERFLDFMLQAGPYGAGFRADTEGLSLAALEAAPHGIDLGPLEPRFPEALMTVSGTIDLAPDQIVADLPRLVAHMDRAPSPTLLLVGRRHLRSNNSWLHNVDVLVRGKERCTLQIHPRDARVAGVTGGEPAQVTSVAGEVEVVVEVTEDIMPGVVSLPHGWGHDVAGTELSVAATRPGVNANRLADETKMDPLSGNAVLNAIPVTVEAVNAAMHSAAEGPLSG